MYSEGKILYFDPFYFKNGKSSPKPKYFLVLHNDNDQTILASLPTREDCVPSSIEPKHGCINDDSINFNCYHFEAKTPITTSGWGFPLASYAYAYQIDIYPIKLLNEVYKIENMDYTIIGTLKDDELKKIWECFSTSKVTRGKFKTILSKKIQATKK